MEFPVELDEFLLCLVDECGTDWELISNEFLEVAASLDPDLQEKAFGVFSPAGLAARYQALTSDQARVETPAIPQVAEPREEPAFQESERIGYSAGEGEIGPEVAPIPSNFSIFNTQNASVLAAYETLKERLPSANIDLDAESGCDSRHEELGNIVDPELTQKTDDIFGTSNLDKIFPPVIDTESTSNVCSMFPSFDATLLSLGVNPNDIEGPLVQVPEEIRPAFDNLRFRMENYDMLDRPEASPQHNQQKTQVIPSMERKPKNVTLYKGIPVQDENEEESQGETSGGDEFLNSRNKMKISSEVALFKAINEGNTMPVKAFNPPPRRPRKPAKTERKAPPPPLPRPSVEKFVVLPLEEASSVSSEDEDEETQDFLGSDAKDLADSSISFPPIPGVVNMENYDLEELEEFKRQTEERRQKLSSRLDEVGLLPRKDELQQAIEKMYVGQAHLYPGQTMSGAKSIPEPEPTPVRIARREPDPLLTKEPEPTIEMLREETAVKEEPEDPLKE